MTAYTASIKREGIEEGIKEGIEQGQNTLVEVITLLSEGKSEEELSSLGYAQKTIDLAISAKCIMLGTE